MTHPDTQSDTQQYIWPMPVEVRKGEGLYSFAPGIARALLDYCPPDPNNCSRVPAIAQNILQGQPISTDDAVPVVVLASSTLITIARIVSRHPQSLSGLKSAIAELISIRDIFGSLIDPQMQLLLGVGGDALRTRAIGGSFTQKSDK